MRKRNAFFILALGLAILGASSAMAAAPDPKGDNDLQQLPAFYRERVAAFRKIIRAQPTREAKIKKAVQLMKDSQSRYKKDAVRFLAEVQAVDEAPKLVAAARKDPEIRDEAVITLTSFKNATAIDYLIELLVDELEDTRSMALLHLEKLTQRTFNLYRPEELNPNRLRAGQKVWLDWWQQNRATFKPTEPTAAEKSESDAMWDRYGLPYLNKP